MDKKDIIDFLASFVKQQKSEVNYGTYRETTRSSLLKGTLSTRANSVWKQSQFIVASCSDDGETDDISSYLRGWAELTRGIYEQYLILECPSNVWHVFDKDGNTMELEDLKSVPQHKVEKAEEPKEGSKEKNFSKVNNSKYRPYITAIKSKPFLLLAGISGTGKSRIVRELARACWEVGSEEYKAQKPRNFEMVQVKPNWHDSTELIGYVSRVSGTPEFIPGPFLKFVARAWEDLETPYFLCLDEMNLAPVEQYFAEYLSVVESRKKKGSEVVTDPILTVVDEQWFFDLAEKITNNEAIRQQFIKNGICLPQNLIVVGTVNMDETTFSFSRKVLDRAMTIEMNDVDLKAGLEEEHENIGLLTKDDLIGIDVEGKDVYGDNKEVCDNVIAFLQAVNDKLEHTPFKIAYRTRNEFLLYVVNNLVYDKDKDGNKVDQDYIIAKALDEITSMKILSRIEGDESKVSKSFLENLCNVIKENLVELKDENGDFKSISLDKLKEMEDRLQSGYTSFWN